MDDRPRSLLGGWVRPTLAERWAHQPNQFPVWLVRCIHGYDGVGPVVLCCKDAEAADQFIAENGPGDYVRHVVVLARRKKAVRRERKAAWAAIVAQMQAKND